jgi:hypothetical protein
MGRNCAEIVQPFLEEADGLDYQVFGGIGSFALQQPGAEISRDEKVVWLPKGTDYSALGQFRADGNRRDLDVLIRSTDGEKVKTVERLAEATIQDELAISVFGLHKAETLDKRAAHPILTAANPLRSLADRYVEKDEQGQITGYRKAAVPFAAADPSLETLETWRLTGLPRGVDMPMPHPGTMILNYLTRSISGLRPKDAEKVGKMTDRVAEKSPEVMGWIHDGPGKSQLQLAEAFYSLRSPKEAGKLHVGGKLELQQLSDLTEDETMMLEHGSLAAKTAVEISRRKARLLHTAESSGGIVTLYQRYVEPHLQSPVKNN